MELRHRSGSIDYSNDSRTDTVFTVDSIESASKWGDSTAKHLNVLVNDVSDMFSDCVLNDEAVQLTIPEWKNGHWLLSEDISSMKHANRVKSLIAKIREVYIASTTISEMYVDGFMNTLLQILHFDDYPCLLYPQYTYSTKIGPRNHTVNAKSDFSVLYNKHQILLVIEDKTTSNANLTNNWKEDQVLGELFVAVHKAEDFPASVYAVRVVGTLFTFYRAIATEEYILETAKQGFAVKSNMAVQRYPPVKKSTQLTAYDICNVDDRKRILECMCSIRNLTV
jgi:hypothetical protein